MPDEYIKRSDFTKAIEEWFMNVEDSRSLQRMLEEIPAADVVPVVRCRDCKYAMMTYSGECKYCKMWMQDGVDEALYLDRDFYCAFAERKEENADK